MRHLLLTLVGAALIMSSSSAQQIQPGDRPAGNIRGTRSPAVGRHGMIATSQSLASAAGLRVLQEGGNAIDAAVTAAAVLAVVEPSMNGIGGDLLALVWNASSGRAYGLDSTGRSAYAATPEAFAASGVTSMPGDGPLVVDVPGVVEGWSQLLTRFGTTTLSAALQPAIGYARGGFPVAEIIAADWADSAERLARDPAAARTFLPGGRAPHHGERFSNPRLAHSLELIAQGGRDASYAGALAEAIAADMRARGGLLDERDFADHAADWVEPISTTYRGHLVLEMPPSTQGFVALEMLNILEGFDIAGMGFGSPDAVHLIAEALKIAFADRAIATADPAFVDVPVERLISKVYAADRRDALDMKRAQHWRSGKLHGRESANTTHVTVADADGHVVSATHTINGLFGASVMIPGTGLIANNYMYNFDPHPGRALSIAPGKRVFSSMAPMMVTDGRRVLHALGLPGALRIFPSAFQAIVNLIDHAMPAQDAVEAPRVWTEGGVLEMEPAYPDAIAEALRVRGHEISCVSRIAGGMNAISIDRDGMMTGVACWRADGTPVGISGGLARAGVRFAI
jgi:gamma-glutamyltranspeptidase/glutathione hydrolase